MEMLSGTREHAPVVKKARSWQSTTTDTHVVVADTLNSSEIKTTNCAGPPDHYLKTHRFIFRATQFLYFQIDVVYSPIMAIIQRTENRTPTTEAKAKSAKRMPGIITSSDAAQMRLIGSDKMKGRVAIVRDTSSLATMT